jgi:hypothetical protein
MDDQSTSMAKEMASDYDTVVVKASGLSRRKAIVNMHRFSSAIYPDGVEEVSLDGVAFVKFYPVEFEAALEDGKHMMRATRKYQLISVQEAKDG